jgi:hypothetical protein
MLGAEVQKSKNKVRSESIEEIAERGCAALAAQFELSDDDADTLSWNTYARVSRQTLRLLSETPAQTMKEALAKARLLAMATDNEGELDWRSALAASLLEDIEVLTALKAQGS